MFTASKLSFKIRYSFLGHPVYHYRFGPNCFLSQEMDLAYVQTGISGVFFWVLNFETLYFLGTGHSCCIFLSSQINALFLSVLCLQWYFLGPILFTTYFSKHSSREYKMGVLGQTTTFLQLFRGAPTPSM